MAQVLCRPYVLWLDTQMATSMWSPRSPVFGGCPVQAHLPHPHPVLRHLPFCRISRCSHKMSPTKSGASSRKQSFPSAQRAAPFIQNFWKSTPFRLNSLTAHITQSRAWVSVHCRCRERSDDVPADQGLNSSQASGDYTKAPDLRWDILRFTE